MKLRSDVLLPLLLLIPPLPFNLTDREGDEEGGRGGGGGGGYTSHQPALVGPEWAQPSSSPQSLE
eukprot:5706526-Pyramimonas_sp.AAC.1